jgi:hypothetical protein
VGSAWEGGPSRSNFAMGSSLGADETCAWAHPVAHQIAAESAISLKYNNLSRSESAKA